MGHLVQSIRIGAQPASRLAIADTDSFANQAREFVAILPSHRVCGADDGQSRQLRESVTILVTRHARQFANRLLRQQGCQQINLRLTQLDRIRGVVGQVLFQGRVDVLQQKIVLQHRDQTTGSHANFDIGITAMFHEEFIGDRAHGVQLLFGALAILKSRCSQLTY